MKYSTLTILILIYFLFIAKMQAQVINTGSNLSIEEAQKALDFHNKVRSDVGVAPLSWSESLAAHAQDWANQLGQEGCTMRHRPKNSTDKFYGENLYAGSSNMENDHPLKASQLWYDEIKLYEHEILNDDNWYDAGHYTQMVWKNTKEVGMGMTQCSNGRIIVVANYNPPGNYLGQKAY